MGDITPLPKRRRHLLRLTTAFAVLITAGTCWQYWRAEHRIPSEQPITATGKYSSPDRATVLTLRNTDDGTMIKVEVSYREGTPQFSGSKWELDATQPWIYTFGSDSKLWGHSENRGPHSWQAAPEASTYTEIGIHGGWSGMPESFLELLPGELRDVHAQWRATQGARPQEQDG